MNEYQVNDSVFEALFRQVVIDNFNEEIDSIPTNEKLAEIYSFSSEFEIRMKRLFVKDRRRNFLKNAMLYSRRVASILAIVLGLLFGTLLFNIEVRAAVGKVFIEWYEKFTSFTFNDGEIIVEKKEWILEYLPEGYIQKDYELLGNVTNMEFINNKGDKIKFSYRPEDSITNISVDNENHKIDNYVILDNEAFLITTVDDRFDNGIIWNLDNHTFTIWGKMPINELNKIAESISER